LTLISIFTGIIAIAGLLVAWILQGGFSKKRRRAAGFWKKLFVRQLLLLPVYLFVVLPAVLGFLGSKVVGTRGDERSYEGPVFDAKGNWICQDRQTLRSGTPETPEGTGAIARRIVHFTNESGRRLRGFFVPCRDGKPKAVAILVHGLFRNAMEVEPVAAMFRNLGADVLLLELSNHGGSDRHAFTFGQDEYRDVLAAVEYLRQRQGGIGAPLILFGVSMGGVAVALAAPKVKELAGLVLDAPMTNMLDTAHRQLNRFTGLPSFFTSMVLWHLEFWSGFDMAEIRPIDAFSALPDTLPVLFVGAGDDFRVPPEVVREGFAALRTPKPRKVLWIEPTAKHGQVWKTKPAEYREHLRALVHRATHSR
jgi:alpha-beta hydrolase superfamily lysophospholipase